MDLSPSRSAQAPVGPGSSKFSAEAMNGLVPAKISFSHTSPLLTSANHNSARIVAQPTEAPESMASQSSPVLGSVLRDLQSHSALQSKTDDKMDIDPPSSPTTSVSATASESEAQPPPFDLPQCLAEEKPAKVPPVPSPTKKRSRSHAGLDVASTATTSTGPAPLVTPSGRVLEPRPPKRRKVVNDDDFDPEKPAAKADAKDLKTAEQKKLEAALAKKQKEEEKKQKEQEKEAEKKRKEEEKRKKEEEKLAKQKQREEEKAKKEEEKKQKEEEKLAKQRQREEEKAKKEEGKKQKEEERKRKEEEKEQERKKAEEKKEKQSKLMASFFTKAPSTVNSAATAASSDPSAPFQTTSAAVGSGSTIYSEVATFRAWQPPEGATVVPLCKLAETKASHVDSVLAQITNTADQKELLNEMKAKKMKLPKRSEIREERKDRFLGVMDFDSPADEQSERIRKLILDYRMKYLQFHENKRPAYFGTWTKTTPSVRPRKPLGQDNVLLDYENDSDEDWEDEVAADDIEDVSDDGSVDEIKAPDDAKEMEYDIDNDFMVADGYLSAGEGGESDESVEGDFVPQRDDEQLLARTKESLKKKGSRNVKAVIIGPVFDLATIDDPKYRDLLENHSVVLFSDTPTISITDGDDSKSKGSTGLNDKFDTPHKGYAPKVIPEALMEEFVRLIHGSYEGKEHLVKEFVSKYKDDDKYTFSKAQVMKKLAEIAAVEQRQGWPRKALFVQKEVLERYNVPDIAVPPPVPKRSPKKAAAPKPAVLPPMMPAITIPSGAANSRSHAAAVPAPATGAGIGTFFQPNATTTETK